MSDAGQLSFATHIRPMFTDVDVAHMETFDLNLSDRDQVAESAEQILQVVTDGSMPPRNSGEARWTPEMCETFKRWKEAGCPP